MAHEQIGLLKPQDLNCNIFSCYDYDGLSLQELLCQFFHKINECIEVSDNTADLAEWLKMEGLKQEVIEQLIKWKNDGTLANIIDFEIFENLKGRMKKVEHNFLTIDDFGAAGDGVTDNYQAITNALKHCWANGIYELYVPEGKYYTTKSIETKEVKLTGLSKPYAPNPIGFEYAHPQNKDRSQALRKKWLDMCGGSIIHSDQNIDIFKDGLYAENLMIFGAVHQPTQHAIGQQYGGPGQQIHLKDVSILCCGHDAIKAPYGLISLRMERCRINYNMGHGMYVGRTAGPNRPDTKVPYTGESNDWIIEQCNFDRNGTDGLELDVMGRSFVIRNNSFEHQGYRSDMGTDTQGNIEQVCYGCRLSLTKAAGGFNAGNVEFIGNYSESSQGLLYVTTQASYANYINIERNLWRAYNNDIMNCGVRLKGRMFNVRIWNNDIYTPGNWNIFMEGDITGVETNNIISYNSKNLNKNVSTLSKLGEKSMPINHLYTHDKVRIGKTVPNVALTSTYDPRTNTTQIHYPSGMLNNESVINGYVNDTKSNMMIGHLLVLNDQPAGYVKTVSTATNTVTVVGNFESIATGSKNLEFCEAGGLYMLNGFGRLVKLVVDNTTNVVAIEKE